MTRATVLTIVLATACGPSRVSTPPPEAPAPAPTTVAVDEGPDASTLRAHPGPPSPWAVSFEGPLGDHHFNRFGAVTLAPTGEVLTISDGTLEVHGPDGGVKRSASVPRPRALGFTHPRQLTLVHEDGLLHFSWPDMVRTQQGTDHDIQAASVGPGRVAVVVGDTFSDRRRVRLLAIEAPPAGGSTRDLPPKVVDWFDLAGRDAGLRLSRDGGLLAVLRRQEVVVRDVATRGELMRYPSKGSLDGAAFSPDGHRLLIGADPPEEVRTSGGGALVAHKHSGSVNGVAFVDGAPVVWDYRQLRFLGEGGLTLDMKYPIFSERGDVLCGQSDEKHYRCLALSPEGPTAAAPLPSDPPTPETPLTKPKPTAPTAPTGYTKRWEAKTRRAGSMHIDPDGSSLLVWSGEGTFAVRSLSDGKVTRTAAICRGRDFAYGFAESSHFVGICENEVVRYAWPSLAEEAKVPLPHAMNNAAVGGGHFAVDVEGKPRIVVYRLTDMKKRLDIQTDAEVVKKSLVMSSDGETLAYSTKSGVWIYDLATRKAHRIMSSPESHLTLTPTGDKLLVLGAQLREVATKDGAQLRAWSSRHIDSAAYAGDDIVVAGFHGLGILQGTGGPVGGWARRSGFGSAVAGHASGVVCSSDRTHIACFEPQAKP